MLSIFSIAKFCAPYLLNEHVAFIKEATRAKQSLFASGPMKGYFAEENSGGNSGYAFGSFEEAEHRIDARLQLRNRPSSSPTTRPSDGEAAVPGHLSGFCGPDRVDCITPARDLGEAGVQRVLGAQRIGGGLGRVQIEEQIAGLDRLAHVDVDRRQFAGIERLDHLGIAGGLDLARATA